MCNYTGGMVPFFKTTAQRLAADRDALIVQAVASDVCNQPTDGGRCNTAAP